MLPINAAAAALPVNVAGGPPACARAVPAAIGCSIKAKASNRILTAAILLPLRDTTRTT
ncbi:hypothetical protein [Vineibacter terrae]|uniref:hypothetical protein n=1 Tax=Vineibacter terrae TaxID=2586908 RepID=UPI001C49924C|nr:hypothetical protein [Vineibacter terrae]